MILTIDSGTTNTRAYVMKEGQVVSSAFQPVGSRDTAITGSKVKLSAGVKAAIQEALGNAGAAEIELEAIIASGMISSNMGLCEIPHLIAPVGKADLARGMQRHSLPDVSSKPVFFIPGIKNTSPEDGFDCRTFDMMRGEETETIGILSQLNCQEEAIVILPGSHTKLVKIDEKQRITGCMTTLAGELAWAIAKSTIIANSLPAQMNVSADENMALEGARFSSRFGLSRACFAVRTMHLFDKTSEAQRLNFLLGAILYQDIIVLKEMSSGKGNIIIGGRQLFRDLFNILLTEYFAADFNIMSLSDDMVANACPRGAWELWREQHASKYKKVEL